MFHPLSSYRDPARTLHALLRNVEETLFEPVSSDARPSYEGQLWPALTIKDVGQDLVITADVPGVSNEDISVHATEQGLTLRGERNVCVPDGYTALRQERKTLQFARSCSLPCKVDLERVRANVVDGVLTVRAAKRPESQPKQIPIQSSEQKE